MPEPSKYTRDIQLAVLFAAAVALTATAASVLAYRKAVRGSQSVYVDHVGDLILCHQIAHSLERKLAKSRMFVLSLEEVYLDEMDEARADLLSLLGRFDTRFTSARRGELLAAIRRSEERHHQLLSDAISTRRSGKTAHAVGLYMSDRLRPPRRDIDAALAELTALESSEVANSLQDARDGVRYARGVSVGAGAASLTIFLIVLALVRGLTERQRELERLLRDENTELDARVAERTRELSVSNRELEGFSYSVAHDLRTPLRTITNFSELAIKELPAAAPAVREKLERVRAAGIRMSALIDALLTLSRLTRRPFKADEVDLSALASSIAADLAREDPERRVTMKIAPGLRDTGDEVLLRVALANLLENAWKFTEGKEDATIEFGRATEGGTAAYFVRDNGAGFDARFAGKLFTPFESLHPKEDYPGAGIGLATVERIVKRHGGAVWARGERGKGAAFFFTLRRGVPAANHGG